MGRKIEYIRQKDEAKNWIRSLIETEKVTLGTNTEYIIKLCLDVYDIGYVDGFSRAEKEIENL